MQNQEIEHQDNDQQDFDHQEAFVAFIDISGFKQKMASREENCAYDALDAFYQSGFDHLKGKNVRGIFVSDCGILYIRADIDPIAAINELLQVIEKINIDMVAHDCMLTTSIAYGPFRHKHRIVFDGLQKFLALGNAYLNAYLDSEAKPKMIPGFCRIVKENLPAGFDQQLTAHQPRIAERQADHKHFYFYWMVRNHDDIDQLEEKYSDSYQRKYGGMLDALKHFTGK